MGSKKKSILKVLTIMVFAVLMMMPVTVSAKVKIDKDRLNQTVVLDSAYRNYTTIYVDGARKSTDKITELKSSSKHMKPNVEYTEATNPYTGKKEYYAYIYIYSDDVAASGKITFKVGGKSYTANIKFIKYENPFLSIKYNDIEFANRYKFKYNAYFIGKVSNKKLTVKLKDNWIVSSAAAQIGNNYKSYTPTYNNKFSKLIGLTKSDDYIYLSLYNTKKKVYQSYYLYKM